MKRTFINSLIYPIIIIGLYFPANAQQRHSSKAHYSLWPGFSNHGVKEIDQHYKLSLNLSSGITGSVKGFELAILSNYNFVYFQGIQIAGLANISGANNRVNPKEPLDETFRGIQFAGIINKTIGNGIGAQLASFNVAGGDFSGLQWAAVTNKARSIIGIQFSGLINSAPEGISGIQVTSLFNYSGAQSNGIQLGLFNYCREAGYRSTKSRLFRDFYQIGLVNISKTNYGNQIGLLNISGKNNGIPLGLLSIDASNSYASIRSDDVFLTSLVISTGSPFYLNTIKVGYNYGIANLPKWGLSYGVEKEWREQSINVRWMCYAGIHLVQLKEQGKPFFKGSRLLRSEFIYARKIKREFFEFGLALSYEISQTTLVEPGILSLKNSRLHPGLILGYRL